MQSRRDEYNADPAPQENRVPPEDGFPPEVFPAGAEDFVPPEDTIPTEFNDHPTRRCPEKSGGSQRHARVKRLFLLPVASVLAAVSIVCAAFKVDPLGYDFLMKGDVSSDKLNYPQQWTAKELPEVDGVVERLSFDVIYLPTDEQYSDSVQTYDIVYEGVWHAQYYYDEGWAAYERMLDWVRNRGGDADSMVLYDYELTCVGQGPESEHSIIVGHYDYNLDGFNMDNGWVVFDGGKTVDLYELELSYVVYPASQGKPTSNAITSVEVTDAVLSYNVGDTPGHTATTPDGADYFVSHEGWFELDESGKIVNEWTWLIDGEGLTDPAALHSWANQNRADNFNGSEVFQFEEGKTYQYVIGVSPNAGFEWAEGCTLTINGKPVAGDFYSFYPEIIEVATMTPTNLAESDSFPSLPNLEPDFAGEYAWAGMGSEEYIMLGDTFIHAGTYYTSQGVEAHDVPGVSYDHSTNTLTLDNYSATDMLDVNLMGNGFTIRLIGENRLSQLRVWGAMYGGSVTLTGDGSLTLNEAGTAGAGLILEAEQSESCLMIDRQVTLEVYGDPAVIIKSTRMGKAIYALEPITVTGGTPAGASDGSEIPLYDYSVADEDGKPSRHVIFSPKK